MALPEVIYALLVGDKRFKITGYKYQSKKPVVIYDTETYRDDPVQLLNAQGYEPVSGVNVGAATRGSGAVTDGGGIGMYAGWALAIDSTATQTPIPEVYAADPILHIPPRQKAKLRTLVEWWDDVTPGVAMTLTITTVSGSAIITVSDAQLLTPGQGITATGVPTGAKILSILPLAPSGASAGSPTLTTAVLSHQATASASVEATLTGSNKLAEAWDDEYIGFSEEVTYVP